jgi:hypothetical protein
VEVEAAAGETATAEDEDKTDTAEGGAEEAKA